jgi:hypothetical protein
MKKYDDIDFFYRNEGIFVQILMEYLIVMH